MAGPIKQLVQWDLANGMGLEYVCSHAVNAGLGQQPAVRADSPAVGFNGCAGVLVVSEQQQPLWECVGWTVLPYL